MTQSEKNQFTAICQPIQLKPVGVVNPDPTLGKTFWWNSKSDKGLQMSYGESSMAVRSLPPSPLREGLRKREFLDHPLPLPLPQGERERR